ncbi:MAG: UDP-3-O-[3-hydroxymyristoyl] glucosamine N-acyltransferase [Halieaceae bacterium]|jgi:UDP-3-O-[3-hydroxymyristoyl] glucosamine N-acyltransferase
MLYTLGEVADRLELSFSGDADLPIVGLAPLDRAAADQLTFVTGSKYIEALRQSCAGAVILPEELAAACPVAYLISNNPYLSYARASQLLDTGPRPTLGIHPSAVVADDAIVGCNVSIGPLASVAAGAVLGEGVIIGAGARVGEGAVIGARCKIYPNAVIYHGVILGSDCAVHSQTVIGSDGFGWAPRPDGWEKIYQLGTVIIGDRVNIGASCAIDRGALDNTEIADGVIIDNQVHIAHNVRIGKNTAIAGCVGIAGSSTIGANCSFAGQVGISGHITICDDAHFTGQARITKSVTEPGTYSSGTPLALSREWARNAARFLQLDKIQKRLKALEQKP